MHTGRHRPINTQEIVVRCSIALHKCGVKMMYGVEVLFIIENVLNQIFFFRTQTFACFALTAAFDISVYHTGIEPVKQAVNYVPVTKHIT